MGLIIDNTHLSYKEKGTQFEIEVGKYYESLGYTIQYHGIEKGKADEGIDLIASKEFSTTLLIQCKNWGKKIDHKEITSIYGLVGDSLGYGKQLVVWSKVGFEPGAEVFAKKKNILLFDNRDGKLDSIKLNTSESKSHDQIVEEKIARDKQREKEYAIIKAKNNSKDYRSSFIGGGFMFTVLFSWILPFILNILTGIIGFFINFIFSYDLLERLDMNFLDIAHKYWFYYLVLLWIVSGIIIGTVQNKLNNKK